MSGRFGATKAQIFEPKEPEEKDVPIEQDTSKKTGMFGGSTKLQIFEPLEPEEKKVSTDDKTNLIVTKTTQKQCSDIKLSKGCRGKNVQEMQKKLIACGYSLPKKGADGIFGPETKAAIINFQKDNNLNSNGIADENTLNKLDCTPSKTASSTKSVSPSVEQPEAETKEKTPASQDYVPDALGIQQAFWLARELFGDMDVNKEDMTQAVTVFDRVIKRMRTEGAIITPREVRKAVDEVKSQYPDLFSGSITENLQKDYYLNIIKNRHNKVEKLVFERLVKGCK